MKKERALKGFHRALRAAEGAGAMRLTVKAVIAGECCSHFRDGPRGVANWCVGRTRLPDLRYLPPL